MNHADAAVFLEEGPAHLAYARHALLAQGGPQLGHAHVLAVEIRLQDFPVTNEDGGHVLHQAPQSFVPVGQPGHEPVEEHDDEGAEEASPQRAVISDDGVLQHVADDEEHHEVEGGELAEEPLPGEAEGHEEEQIDDNRSQDFLHDRDVGYQDAHVPPFGWAREDRSWMAPASVATPSAAAKKVGREDGLAGGVGPA